MQRRNTTQRRAATTDRTQSAVNQEDADSSGGSSDEAESEFEPSSEDEASARPAATPRRRSAPARAASATAVSAVVASSRRAPTRSQSAASSATTPAAATKRKPPAKHTRTRRREETDEVEEEEEESKIATDSNDSEAATSSSDSDADMEAQCGSLKKRRRSNARRQPAAKRVKRKRTEEEGDTSEGDGCESSKKPAKRGRSVLVDPSSFLSQYDRVRDPFGPPSSSFHDVFARLAVERPPSLKPGRAHSAAATTSAAASSPAMAIEPSSFVDFTLRLPTSVASHVFTFCNVVHVARSERVCKRWQSTIAPAGQAGCWKALFGAYFPLLKRVRDATLRRQDSGIDPVELRKADSDFFEKENPAGLTAAAARRTEGRSVPIFDPLLTAPIGTLSQPTRTLDEVLRPKEGEFSWKHTLINRLAASCVECRALTLDVFKLTRTRVCIECAMQRSRFDVVNSGCAKGKFLLAEREVASLPSVTEYDPVHADRKTVFHLLGMVRGLSDFKYGGRASFECVWAEKVAEAHKRLALRREEGRSTKRLIPKVYRPGVGSTPEKTKGFFLCGRHNLATLYEKTPAPRPYPAASLE